MSTPTPITTLLLSPLEYPKAWKQHYERLKTACQYFEINFPFLSIDEFKALLQKQMERLKEPAVIRLEITKTGIQFHPRGDLKNEPLKLKTIPLIRTHNQYKTLGYQAEEQVLEEITAEGFNEILRVTSDNLFSEAAYRNIVFQINHKYWVTPEPRISQCLPGLELQRIIHLAKQNNLIINYDLCPLSWLEQDKITAAFTTNSVKGVEPVVQINRINLSEAPVQELLKLMLYTATA